MTALVVGVGNRVRRDDGVGPQVADRLRRARPDLEVSDVSGDASRLLELWTGHHPVVVVDAVRTGAPVGTCHRWRLLAGGWDLPLPPSQLSSHLVGVREAIDLATALGRLPRGLVVVGVEVADLGVGEGLSAAVAAAIDGAVDLVLESLAESG